MREYVVWLRNCGPVHVKAERLERQYDSLESDTIPTKLLFYIGDRIIAEFYIADSTHGWVELTEE